MQSLRRTGFLKLSQDFLGRSVLALTLLIAGLRALGKFGFSWTDSGCKGQECLPSPGYLHDLAWTFFWHHDYFFQQMPLPVQFARSSIISFFAWCYHPGFFVLRLTAGQPSRLPCFTISSLDWLQNDVPFVAMSPGHSSTVMRHVAFY